MVESGMQIRPATTMDIDLLVKLRIAVLREANCMCPEQDTAELAQANRDYFLQTLGTDKQLTLLAFINGKAAGCGSICFYNIMPTSTTPSGRNAYVMNMYTCPAYRGKGVGRSILQQLLEYAQQRGAQRIMLEASDDGRRLYSHYGFETAPYEMEYYPGE